MPNSIIRPEREVLIGGKPARAFNVIADENGRILNQEIIASRTYGQTHRITASLRFDDQCGNGHETFSITGNIDRQNGKRWIEESGGCIHDEIAKHFPRFAPFIKWHLCSTDGPMHYVANTLYMAGDRDYNGRAKGDASAWEYGVLFGNSPVTHRVSDSFAKFLKERIGTGAFQVVGIAHEIDPKTYGTHYTLAGYGEKWHECPFRDKALADEFCLALNTCKVEFVVTATAFSEGKTRELEHARHAAIWPDATDAALSLPRDELKAVLETRLPQLLADFKAAMLEIGFVWPQHTRICDECGASIPANGSTNKQHETYCSHFG